MKSFGLNWNCKRGKPVLDHTVRSVIQGKSEGISTTAPKQPNIIRPVSYLGFQKEGISCLPTDAFLEGGHPMCHVFLFFLAKSTWSNDIYKCITAFDYNTEEYFIHSGVFTWTAILPLSIFHSWRGSSRTRIIWTWYSPSSIIVTFFILIRTWPSDVVMLESRHLSFPKHVWFELPMSNEQTGNSFWNTFNFEMVRFSMQDIPWKSQTSSWYSEGHSWWLGVIGNISTKYINLMPCYTIREHFQKFLLTFIFVRLQIWTRLLK